MSTASRFTVFSLFRSSSSIRYDPSSRLSAPCLKPALNRQHARGLLMGEYQSGYTHEADSPAGSSRLEPSPERVDSPNTASGACWTQTTGADWRPKAATPIESRLKHL